jgi:uncharacterized protein with PIN domain
VRFKLDENPPVELALELRDLGYDVDTVNVADPEVVDAAFAADRILFTLDKGIANLQRYPVHQHAGGAVIAFVRERLQKVLELDLTNRLTVVGPSCIRFK